MGPRYEQQTTSKDETYEFVKKLSKFIMWFSVFTFFVSNPSWLSLFLHSFIAHVSNFPSQFLAHINDKNYIFLLCNGILVILAKSSRRLMSGNSESLEPPEAVTITTNEAPSLLEAEQDREILMLQNHGLIEMEPEVLEENEFPDEENRSDEDEESDEWHVEVGKEEGGEGSVARMSTEDLNRKFEEFIRRMKQEIRIEAQQQLVMV